MKMILEFFFSPVRNDHMLKFHLDSIKERRPSARLQRIIAYL